MTGDIDQLEKITENAYQTAIERARENIRSFRNNEKVLSSSKVFPDITLFKYTSPQST